MLLSTHATKYFYDALRKIIKEQKGTAEPVTLIDIVLDDEYYRLIMENKERILAEIPKTYSKDVSKLLELLEKNAPIIREKIMNGEEPYRSIILSYTLQIVFGKPLPDALVIEIMKHIPSTYRLPTGDITLIEPTNEELMQIKAYIVNTLEDTMRKVLSRTVELDVENKKLKLFDLPIALTGHIPLMRIAQYLQKSVLVTDIVSRIVNERLENHSLQPYIKSCNMTDINTIEIVAEIDAINHILTNKVLDKLQGKDITIKYHIDYTSGEIYGKAVLDHEVGKITVNVPRARIDKIDESLSKTLYELARILNNTIPFLATAKQLSEKLGYKYYPSAYLCDKGFHIIMEKQIPISKEASVGAEIQIRGDTSENEYVVESYVSVALKDIGLFLEELKRNKELAELNPHIETHKAIFKFVYGLDELESAIERTESFLSYLQEITTKLATKSEELRKTRFTSQEYLALYLAKHLAVDDINISSITGRTEGGVLNAIWKYLVSKGIDLSGRYKDYTTHEILLLKSDDVIKELVKKNVLTLDESLTLRIDGKRIKELLDKFDKLSMNYNTTILENIIISKILKMYPEATGHSFPYHMMKNNKLNMNIVEKAIEAKTSIEIDVLVYNINGKTVWEQLSEQHKRLLLKRLTVDEISIIEKHPMLPISNTDKRLIVEALCDGTRRSVCTEYIAKNMPEIIHLPRAVKITKDADGETFIDAGIYRIQVSKILSGRAEFIIYNKLTGRTARVEARTVLDAVYLAEKQEEETHTDSI